MIAYQTSTELTLKKKTPLSSIAKAAGIRFLNEKENPRHSFNIYFPKKSDLIVYSVKIKN
jgi:hypothetical protein